MQDKMKWKAFLKDVFICSLGAYGGPEAHYGVITDQMVIKRKYLAEEELVELIALTTILPGPSSTQTIVSIGYKFGGPLLALLTMLVWAMPILILMILLSFLSDFLERINISNEGLRYVGPMAVGFILLAAYRIVKKVVRDKVTLALFIFGTLSSYFFRQSWIYPLVLVLGAMVSIITTKETRLWNSTKISPPWPYLFAFLIFASGSLILSIIFNNTILDLFERFYRYGYLVIGGGQVVVPFMHNELVEIKNYMTNQEFLTGYGLVQGLPGPMFSFSAYAGSIASRYSGPLVQIIGGLVSGIAIFLPGLLLIFFIYPIWESLKKIKGIKISLKGITPVAGGLLTVAAILLMQETTLSIDNILITIFTVLILLTKKVPAPFIVLATLIVGFIL